MFFLEQSLKHVKSGKCIHPKGGRPRNDRNLIIYSGCDATRLQLLFIEPGMMQCQKTMYNLRCIYIDADVNNSNV